MQNIQNRVCKNNGVDVRKLQSIVVYKDLAAGCEDICDLSCSKCLPMLLQIALKITVRDSLEYLSRT